MPLYRINAPGVGSYVEGLGVLPFGKVVDVPTSVVVKRHGRDKRIPVVPRLWWIPQNEEAWAAFHAHFGTVKQLDADGRPVLDANGDPVELKDAAGQPVWVQPHADSSPPEPELTPEEEDAAAAAKLRDEELERARKEAIEQYKRTSSEAKPAASTRHSDREPDREPPPVTRRG